MKIKSIKSHHIFRAFLFFTALAIPNLTKSQDISQGLVGYWSMECNAGDVSGNKNDGLLIKSPVCTTGKIDSAFIFDGTSQFIQLPKDSSTKFYDNSGFTWSLWFKGFNLPKSNTFRTSNVLMSMIDTTSLSNFNITLSFGNGTNYTNKNLVFRVDGANAISFPNPHFQPGSGFKDSIWYHVVAVCNYKTNQQALYLDGIKVDSSNLSINPITKKTIASIGAYFDLIPNNMFNGIIDEVRIHNRILTNEEIALLANEKKNYLNPDSIILPFGNILCKNTDKKSFTLTNTGSEDFTITKAVNKNTTIFNVNDGGSIKLVAGQSYPLEIQFTPTALGKYYDTVLVYNSSGALPLKLFVEASKDIPSLSKSDTIDFGEIVRCNADTTVTLPYALMNSDVFEGIKITNVKYGNPADTSNIKVNDTLKYNKSYNSSITVRATAIGSYDGIITLVLGDCGFEKKIYVKATVTDVVAKVPLLVDFGNKILGMQYDTTIYVINRSSRVYTIAKVTTPQAPFSMDEISPSDLGLKNIGDTLKINLHVNPIPGNQNSAITITIQSPCGDKDIVVPLFLRGRYLAEFDVSIPDYLAKTGDRLQIPIKIHPKKDFANSLIDSIKFRLKYNNSSLIPLTLLPKSVSMDTSFLDLTYAVMHQDIDQSFNIDNFDVALGEVEIDSLIIQNFQVVGGFAATNIKNGSVKITNICKENGSRFFSDDTPNLNLIITPNIINNHLKFDFNAIEDGNYLFKMTNSNGIFTEKLFESYLKRGAYQFNFNLDNASTGLYFLNIISPSNVFNCKVQVVK